MKYLFLIQAIVGGIILITKGRWNYIVAGILKCIFGVLTLLVEGSVLCVCLKGYSKYEKVKDKFEATCVLRKAITYVT